MEVIYTALYVWLPSVAEISWLLLNESIFSYTNNYINPYKIAATSTKHSCRQQACSTEYVQ